MWTIEIPDVSLSGNSFSEFGERVESEGWDGVSFVDSQNICPEPYALLSAMATATSRIGLGVSVTNPVTRHPALAASAAATVNRISGGRLVISIGRGDSALAHLGLAPVGVTEFERYVRALRQYLRGEALPMQDAAAFAMGRAKPAATLGLADEPESSLLQWTKPSDAVPLEVTAAGARVLDVAARYADRVMIAVGAVPERVKWAVDLVGEAGKARRGSGRPSVGAYVAVAVNDDPALARDCLRPSLASTARFSILHGRVSGPVDAASVKVLEKIHGSYNMKEHGQAGTSTADVLDDAFTSTYGIAGTPQDCIRRLTELCDLGVDKFCVFSLAMGADPDVVQRHRTLLANEVIPAVKSYQSNLQEGNS